MTDHSPPIPLDELPSRAAPWVDALAMRLRHRFGMKLLGTTVVTWIFMLGYLYLLSHPQGPVTTVPLTAIDEAVAFDPRWMPVYLSLWLYAGSAPGLLLGGRTLAIYTSWISALCFAGLVIFYVWPTQSPVSAPSGVDFPGFALIRGVDSSGNACPSMHVAAALFTACASHVTLRQIDAPGWLKVLNGSWCAAIMYSTLAIKQHVVWDVVAGALLALVFFAGWRAASPAPLRA